MKYKIKVKRMHPTGGLNYKDGDCIHKFGYKEAVYEIKDSSRLDKDVYAKYLIVEAIEKKVEKKKKDK
jgi:hypothetical protein